MTQQVYKDLLQYLKKLPSTGDTTCTYVPLPDFVIYLVIKNRKNQVQSIVYDSFLKVLCIKVKTREGFFTQYFYNTNSRFRATILVNIAVLVNVLGQPLA